MTRHEHTASDGSSVLYDVDGPDNAPVLVLMGSLGTNTDFWRPQLRDLAAFFNVVRIEHPGHGLSEGGPGPYTIETMGTRALGVLDGIGVRRFSFAGLSLGGQVGMWLGSETDRVERLALCCTSAQFGPPEPWIERAAAVRRDGLSPLLEALLGRWFTRPYLDAHPDLRRVVSEMLSQSDPDAYASCCEAIAYTDMGPSLGRIQAPTLVLAGSSDPVVTPEVAVGLMEAIHGASLTVLNPAAHLATIEQHVAATSALVTHFAGAASSRGSAMRRAVLGDAHVDRALEGASDFAAPFQDFLTRWPWGDVWSRPGLDRRTRRLITIALLVSLDRPEELAMHIRAALADGLTQEDLREVLLQTAVYAGVPAANAAFAIADRIVSGSN
jgi:3-oxoadipate enol-lactonase / 4-carboxymuconolactone decarboxylase